MNNTNTKIVLAAIGGAIVGAGIALLFAPASGKETRKKITDKINDTTDKMKDSLASLKNKTGEILEQEKEKIKNSKA